MKIAKRTLAIVMAMLMVISTFAVAASAEGVLQDKIDAAASGDVVTVDQVNAVESIVINGKNITLDLKGNTLNSAYGKPAIIVKGGATVTIKNGHVESRAKQYSGAEQFLKALEDVGSSPSAIQAEGANTKVILDNVRVVGSFFRIPRREDNYVPTGSALKLIGAEAELHGTMLTGSYGISGYNGAKATIYDATLLGYLDATRGTTVTYDEDTVEKVNAADRIAGYLSSGITLENWELDLIKQLMDDRAYIYTQKPTSDKAKVTVDKVEGTAVVTAEEIAHLNANSDCSYKYVPKFAYLAEAGTRIALNTPVDAALVEDDVVLVKYQLEFDLQGDIAKYIKNFYKYVDYAYTEGLKMADQAYDELLAKYDSALRELVDVYNQIDDLGAKVVFGKPIAEYCVDDETGENFYYAIMRDVIALGGVTMYNKAMDDANEEEGEEIYSHLTEFKVQNDVVWAGHRPAASEYTVDENGMITSFGTLDKLNALVEEFKALKGNSSFSDQSKWAAYALFLVDNYEAVLDDILPELQTKLESLAATIGEGKVGDALAEVGDADLDEATSIITDGVKYVKKANEGIDKLFDTPYFADMRAQLAANRDDVAENVEKAIYVYNHKEQYVNPDNFIDGNFVKAYYLDGGVEPYYVLHVDVDGAGSVTYTPAGEDAEEVTITEETEIVLAAGETLTLNAVADEGNQFVNWTVGGEEVGTEPAFTADDSYALVAVFEENPDTVTITVTGIGSVSYNETATNSTATVEFRDSITLTAVETADSGYAFTGWKVNGEYVSTEASFTVTETTAVEAVFEEIPVPLDTVTITVTGTGSVSYNETATNSTATVEFEDSITLTAVEAAGSGYTFIGWKVDGEYVSNATSIEIVETTAVEAVFGIGNLHLYIEGHGIINYDGKIDNVPYKPVAFDGSITLTATPDDGYEFLYWQNKESGRIMSTNKTMTLETGLSRYIAAVFEKDSVSSLVLTSNSGAYVHKYNGTVDQSSFTLSGVTQTYAAGYDFGGWGPSGVDSGAAYSVSGLPASGYKVGNSAFDEVGVLYGNDGYAFKLNATTENKYLVTSKFVTPDATYSVLFHDPAGQTIGNSAMHYGKAVTYTAKGGNFSYWTDDAGHILCVNAKFRYVNDGVDDVNLYANYGAGTKQAVINIDNIVEQDGSVVLYARRSVKTGLKLLSSGIIYSVDSEIEPAVENVDNVFCKKITSTQTTNDGVHNVTLDLDELALDGDGVVTARAFLEVEGLGVIYSDQVYTNE